MHKLQNFSRTTISLGVVPGWYTKI